MNDGVYTFTREARYSNSGTQCNIQSSGSYTITIGDPDAEIATPANTTLCENSSITLTTVTPYNSNYKYQWYNGTTAIVGATSNTYIATEAGSYSIVVTDKISNCSNQDGTPVVITVAPSVSMEVFPTYTVVCEGGEVTITAELSYSGASISEEDDEEPANDEPVTTPEVHYLAFASDRHIGTNNATNAVYNAFNPLNDSIEYVCLIGDMVGGTGNMYPEYSTSSVLTEIKTVFPDLDNTTFDITCGNHDVNYTDDANIMNCTSGLIYTGKNSDNSIAYYVYGVANADMANASNASTAANAFKTWVSSVDPSIPVFVLSHMPMHETRHDNYGASYWHNALNYAARNSATGSSILRDVFFFCGHNHTTSTAEYYYPTYSSYSVQNTTGKSGTNHKIYYTYATAGYIRDNNHATQIKVDGSQIILTKTGESEPYCTVNRVQPLSDPVSPAAQDLDDEDVPTVTYQWYEGSGDDMTILTGKTGINFTATPSESTSYTVIATIDGHPCIDTLMKSVTITIVEKPEVTVSAGNDVTVCSGAEATFEASATTTPTGAVTNWQWYSLANDIETEIENATSSTYTISEATTTGSYVVEAYVTFTDSTSHVTCDASAQDTVTLTVNAKPTVSVDDLSDLCPTETMDLTATASDDVTSYRWSSDDLTINNSTSNPATAVIPQNPCGQTYTIS